MIGHSVVRAREDRTTDAMDAMDALNGRCPRRFWSLPHLPSSSRAADNSRRSVKGFAQYIRHSLLNPRKDCAGHIRPALMNGCTHSAIDYLIFVSPSHN